MHYFKRILTGLKHPSLAISELQNLVHRTSPHDIGVQGSYTTGNIGDRALGQIFKRNLSNNGYSVRTFSKNTTSSNAPVRILGGGGILHDWYGPDHLEKRLNYVHGGRVSIVAGVGAPGFETEDGKELAREILPKMDLITVRDEWSKNNIHKVCDVEVEVTACPVFTQRKITTETNRTTGINLRPYFLEDDKTDDVLRNYFEYDDLGEARERYLKNVTRICDRVDNPVFIPFHQKDELFAQKHLDIPILEYQNSVRTTLQRISRVENMVTMRYHSLIFSLLLNKPVLPIAYEPKVSELAKRVNIDFHNPLDDFPLKFNKPSNITDIQREAWRNFSIINDIIAAK